jgi:glycine dehydrogenase subunit 1
LTRLTALSRKNKPYDAVFLGAGSYRHYIPPVVTALTSREEFVTAYTPYQAEMSQGILQAMFEYQSFICRLTGMDVSNASHYSGATAAAEACIMAADKVKRVVTFSTVRGEVLATIATYLKARGIALEVIDCKDGKADLSGLEGAVGAVYAESPNFFGIIEDAAALAEITHSHGGKFILGCNPVSLALLKSPKELGADIAVGEGQPLGIPLGFGGPYLGYIATTNKEMRRLPGRIVGETTDREGNKAYVLTLQAREQHIRREKATSNICSNEAHCALTAAVYLSAVGKEGLKEVALHCTSNAHYLAKELTAVGAKLKYPHDFFHEFVTVTPGKAGAIVSALEAENILGGLAFGEEDDQILWCTTELNSKDEMDKVASVVREVLAK